MNRRKPTAFVRCHWDGCKDTAHFEYDNQRDYSSGKKRRDEYFCSVHRDYNRTLRPDNPRVILELTVVEHNGNKYWADNGHLRSGFIFGEGFVASADLFPVGATIRITAEVTETIWQKDKGGEGLLGEPEIDRKQEAEYEAGDAKYDAMVNRGLE